MIGEIRQGLVGRQPEVRLAGEVEAEVALRMLSNVQQATILSDHQED